MFPRIPLKTDDQASPNRSELRRLPVSMINRMFYSIRQAIVSSLLEHVAGRRPFVLSQIGTLAIQSNHVIGDF